jgi:uncharacterized protein
VRSLARVSFEDPERLARQMARHFAHKVEVTESGGRHTVTIPAGRFELEAAGEQLLVDAQADDPAGLARVEQVCADHLARFAHQPLDIRWVPVD